MPLARTPPKLVNTAQAIPVTPRAHTFAPSQAYPEEAFRPQGRVQHSPAVGDLPRSPAIRVTAPEDDGGVGASEDAVEEVMQDELEVDAPAPIAASASPRASPRAMSRQSASKPTRPPPSPLRSRVSVGSESQPTPAIASTSVSAPTPAPAPAAPSPSTLKRPRPSMPRLPEGGGSPTSSRMKRARKSLAAGIVPGPIHIEVEDEPQQEQEPELEPAAPPMPASATTPAQTRVPVSVLTPPPEPVDLPEPTAMEQPEPEEGHALARSIAGRAEPEPKTPRGRGRLSRVHAEVGARTPAEVLAEPARKVADVSDPPYGRFYEKLLETLQKQVMQKLELKPSDMEKSFPLIAAKLAHSNILDTVRSELVEALQRQSNSVAMSLISQYHTAERMKDLNLMIDDARAWAAAHPGEGRPDAWRPDLTPYVRSTATNLELYDKKWSSLRDEYNELVGECVELSERVQAKRDQLERDNGVADSVGELAQANKLLQKFPMDKRLVWSESVEAKMRKQAKGRP